MLLFVGGPEAQAIRSIRQFWNLGHIAYFALLVYLLLNLRLLGNVSIPYRWVMFITFTLVLGALIEFIQGAGDRDMDIMDMFRNLVGCLLALSFHPSTLKSKRRIRAIMIRAGVLLLLIISLLPLSIALIDEAIARAKFPILSSFDTPFELDRWDGNAGKEIIQLDSEIDSHQLKLELTTDLYSGTGLKYMPTDWRGYYSLHLRIFQPLDEKIDLTIRIHDLAHVSGRYPQRFNDRFNKRYKIIKGWNEIVVDLSTVENAPMDRKMDMTEIIDASLFAVSLAEPKTIYLDKIYLTHQ